MFWLQSLLLADPQGFGTILALLRVSMPVPEFRTSSVVPRSIEERDMMIRCMVTSDSCTIREPDHIPWKPLSVLGTMMVPKQNKNEVNKTARKMSCHFTVDFLQFCQFLGTKDAWLSSHILRKLVLTVSAWLSIFHRVKESSELPTLQFCWHQPYCLCC